MPERKTVGQLMEEMRLKAGAQNYHGHEYMDLERFAEDTRHMIIFDVLTHDSPVGWKGERTRLFLTEAGYQKSLENQEKGHIALYGVLSNRRDLDDCPIALRPVLSLKARIALTKDLHTGEGAGYGLEYVAESDRKIAVLSIGYADGIPRALSCNHGKVLINGYEAPIIGRICMDQMIVDITDLPDVKSGDIAVIIGKSGQYEITAYDLAEASGTITNELLSRLGSRLNRMIV